MQKLPADHRAAAAILSGWRNDPCRFVADVWPHVKLASYQAAILRSVRDNTETFVPSSNESGKSFSAGLCSLWFFCTRRAKVITSSTTEGQLENVLWGEIDHLLRTASIDFGLMRKHLQITLSDESGEAEQKHYLKGLVTNVVESFQGHHLATLPDGSPTVFFLFEEASGTDEEFYRAATSQAHRILMIGNTLRANGIFAEKCQAGDMRHATGHPDERRGLYRKIIRVRADDSPNVAAGKRWQAEGRPGHVPQIVPGIISWQQYLERRANWPPQEQRMRLDAEFPGDGNEKLFPDDWLDIAMRLGRAVANNNAERTKKKRTGRPYAMGIDVSFGGGDKTVWTVVGKYGVRYVEARDTPDTTEISGRTIRLMKRFGIADYAVAFDSGGGGKQIADAMRGRGLEGVVDIGFGEAPDNRKEYRNRRSELYGELRKALMPKFDEAGNLTAMLGAMLQRPPERWLPRWHCFSIPDDLGDLVRDLSVLPLSYDEEGRLRLPPKDRKSSKVTNRTEKTVRELLGGRSPDYGDSCVLAWFAYRRMQAEREAREIDGDLVFSTRKPARRD